MKVEHSQAFFVTACLKNAEYLVGVQQRHERGYQLCM